MQRGSEKHAEMASKGEDDVLEPPVEEELVGDDGEEIGKYEEENECEAEGQRSGKDEEEGEDKAEEMEVDDDGDEYTDEEYGSDPFYIGMWN